MTELKECPCRSGQPFSNCCSRLLSGGENAATAEALMRSRYSAFVLKNIAYLLSTWHPTTRPSNIDPATIPAWKNLVVIRTKNGRQSDSEGIVEFQATAISDGKILKLCETSRFVKEDGCWFYIDGTLEETQPGSAPDSKVGRNEPCPCTSGKKFKKCCGP
ncbi:MAG: YchJ family metal-binding protein [Thermodesulfobacteriota bacterium]